MIYYKFSLKWYSPYTEPPEGFSRVLIDDVVFPNIKRWSSRNVPGCVHMICDQMQREGLKYVISICSEDTKPRRTQSLAGKQSRRRSLLRGRIMKQQSLFFDEVYKQALAENPEYFGTP